MKKKDEPQATGERLQDAAGAERRMNRLVTGAGVIVLLAYSIVDYLLVPELWGTFLVFRVGFALLGLGFMAFDMLFKRGARAAYYGFWIPVFILASVGASRLPSAQALLVWNIQHCVIILFIAGTVVRPPRGAWVLPATAAASYIVSFLFSPGVSVPGMIVNGGVLYLAGLAIMYPLMLVRRRPFVGNARTHPETAARNDELLALNAAKDRFFSLIAHDLKGPIGSAARVLNRMLEPGTEVERADLVVVGEAVNRSYSLLENLLLWARSQRGEIIVIPVELNLGRLVGQVWEEFNEAAGRKGLALDRALDEAHSIVVDKKTAVIIIRNLLSNAVRYSHEGGRIGVTSEKRGDRIVLEVRDTGPGMDAEAVGRLFKIDEKQDNFAPDGAKGTGLGLILCQELAEKNNGAIGVVSVPGQGTSFFLELPSA